MRKRNTKFCYVSASMLSWALSSQVLAQDAIQIEPVAIHAPMAESDMSTVGSMQVLSDRVHQISADLGEPTAVHSYSFTSARGQNVLLGTPDIAGFNSLWKVEYRKGDGEWTLKRYKGPELFQSLQPGTTIEVRVSAVSGMTFEKTGYKLVFGSAPRMNYDLHHEEGLLRVPYGRTEPPMLATQAIKQTLLEISFTDSKGTPLEGGVANFVLNIPTLPDPLLRRVTSNSSGTYEELLEVGTCTGGKAASNFVHKNNGRNTWATRYQVGKYYAENVLLQELANKPHVYDFGHICKRTLVNWSRN